MTKVQIGRIYEQVFNKERLKKRFLSSTINAT